MTETHTRSDRHFHCRDCGACCDTAMLRSEGAALCPTHEAAVIRQRQTAAQQRMQAERERLAAMYARKAEREAAKLQALT